MLKAWSDEFDPKNLTINEALFVGGLTGGRAEVRDGNNQDADVGGPPARRG
ncbi:d6dabfc7-74d8-49b0-8dbc-77d387dccda6 [Thermothielavioides terrestris]|uniref:D6dabfc7-74d8-49b0-8dbc-77d387dccda6 n=1 Tax=Thermothielavioides terrestris TaxID=2587410 RepID=A0A3S4C2Z6_9PEZI|nr:d6dabfc7-74d8-49b0-8dbc-77d387dccda6 [Thermothielavioides terrestris]